ncbi:cysteine hydrolase family protein [Vagococcus elongatus]|uniref:Isochorismatase n=1 Tax=Vagococcus elongatus TaxID=180344 RepID=A0A430AYI3_9ENTE|nr:isochorismatase family cysteine hydrolase [Vagococcus elongatus]RSU13127.1 isochorismatase [Vagococcus elongatus]
MKALLIIDYTWDFVATEGRLTTGEPGQKIEEEIVRLAEGFADSEDYIVFPIDGHDEEDQFHPENKLFPPHNLIGTNGRELYGNLATFYEKHKNQRNVYWIDKRHYSAFSGTDLDIRLRERGIKELHITGVCTDICVLHTAIDAYNLGYKIVIHEKGVASFNQVGHEWALEHFKGTLGAEVV